MARAQNCALTVGSVKVASWPMCGRCGPRRGRSLSRLCGSPHAAHGISSTSGRLTRRQPGAGRAGVRALSYRTVKRRLPGYAKPEWRNRLSGACAAAAQLGPSALVLYDVTVRHEALVARAGVRDHCRGPCRSRGCEAGGSLTGETPGRVGAALTKPCRVSTVGWRGRGERAEEVYARNRCDHLS